MPKLVHKLGVLLVGHGTASPLGTTQFLAVARQLGERLSPTLVEPAFLEIQQPDIAEGARRIVECGATDIVVAPLLLLGAGHTKRDIPLAIKSTVLGLPKTRFEVVQAEHLGKHRAIIKLSRLRFGEACMEKGPVPAGQTVLVLVGRGSTDESAIAEMHEFARLRHQPRLASEMAVCFLAMGDPSLEEALTAVAHGGIKRVVVQPHLLFAGDLADSVRRMVSKFQRRNPSQEWLVAPVLADSQDFAVCGNELLLEAVCDRFTKAVIRVVASW